MNETKMPSDERLLVSLKEVVREVFETMLTVECMSSDPLGLTASDAPHRVRSSERVAQHAYEALIAFDGDVRGTVLLRCEADGAAELARGLLMMGPTEMLGVGEISDALGECANMVTGSLEASSHEGKVALRLAPPIVAARTAEHGPDLAGTLSYRLSKDFLAVELWVESD